MEEINFTIHMVPVAKGRPRFARMGRFTKTYTPQETLIAENNILAQAMRYKPSVPFSKYAVMRMEFYMPIPKSMLKRDRIKADLEELPHTKKPDLDNIEKAVLDALNGIFYVDDAIIWEVAKMKKYSNNPRIVVKIVGE